MALEALYIGLSKHKVLCCEKPAGQGNAFLEKAFDVGYNQSPLHVFLDGMKQVTTGAQAVYCALKYPFFVLVPEVLFNEADAPSYLEGNDLTGKRILFDKLSRSGIVCVYPVEHDVYEKLILKYPNIIVRHFASVLVDATLKKGIAEKSTLVELDFENEEFYMCITKGASLMMCNRFAFKSPEDVLYFVLYGLEQFDIQPNEVSISTSGLVDINMASIILLNEYFEQVQPSEVLEHGSPDFKFQANLFHQHACV